MPSRQADPANGLEHEHGDTSPRVIPSSFLLKVLPGFQWVNPVVTGPYIIHELWLAASRSRQTKSLIRIRRVPPEEFQGPNCDGAG